MGQMLALMGIVGVLGLADSAQSTDKPQTAQTSTLKVSGMVCGACAATVERTLKKIDGVTTVVVSQPKGRAEITFDPGKTNPNALAKAINEKTSFRAELTSSHPKK